MPSFPVSRVPKWLRVALCGCVVSTHAFACTSADKPRVAGAIAGAGASMPAGAGNGGSDGGAALGLPGSGKGSSGGDSNQLTAAITISQVPVAGEQHMCVIVELPNPQPVWVNEIHATLSTGSHHLIVDRRSSATNIQTDAAACTPTMAGDDTRLLIAQQLDTRLTLPSGVAYKLDAHQRIFLQLHYINLSTKAEDIQGSVELRVASQAAGTPIEAQSLFAGAHSINLPPHSPGAVSSFQVPGRSADTGTTRHVFALTSHTHSLGVRATIERVASPDAPATQPIHESLNWSEPPLTMFDPPLDFTDSGNDGLRLICDYMNNTDRTVMFGTAFEDEMCFMWMYFYDE
jgi:hypothetical protein